MVSIIVMRFTLLSRLYQSIPRHWRNVFLEPNLVRNGPSAFPSFLGLALMSDGDQTQTESAADYADFVVAHR